MATLTHSQPLPTVQERPGADLVIFDGDCRFCTNQVQRLSRWDRRGQLAFISLHDPLVTERFPDLTHEALMQDMYLVDPVGGRHRGAAAFRYLTRRIPRLWPLAPLMHIPGSLPLWQRIYRFVAARRYLMGRIDACDDGSCAVHFNK